MAKQRGATGSRDRRRRDRKGPVGGGRRKSCPYCRHKVDHVDYKDVSELRRAVSDKGKFRSSRAARACRLVTQAEGFFHIGQAAQPADAPA